MFDSNKLILDSRDRQISTDSVTNYRVSLSKPMQNVSSVALKEITIPWVIYNVSLAKANHQMTVNEATVGDFTITIADGWYDMSSLCSAIQTALDAGGSNTYTVTYNTNTMKVTITANTYNIIVYGSNSTGKTTGLEQELGFLLATTASLSATSSNVPKLLQPKYLLLTLDFLADNIDTIDGNKNASFLITPSINASSSFGGSVVRIAEGDNWIQKCPHTSDLSTFRVSLRDENNVYVELNGCDWHFVLEFYFVHQVYSHGKHQCSCK